MISFIIYCAVALAVALWFIAKQFQMDTDCVNTPIVHPTYEDVAKILGDDRLPDPRENPDKLAE